MTIDLTELLLNRPKLLAQKIFALRFGHIFLRFGADMMLHHHAVKRFFQQFSHRLETLQGVALFEERLRFVHLQFEVRQNSIGQTTGRLHIFRQNQDIRWH